GGAGGGGAAEPRECGVGEEGGGPAEIQVPGRIGRETALPGSLEGDPVSQHLPAQRRGVVTILDQCGEAEAAVCRVREVRRRGGREGRSPVRGPRRRRI